jgi:secondary thiamine-phosphate synthase enzyme
VDDDPSGRLRLAGPDRLDVVTTRSQCLVDVTDGLAARVAASGVERGLCSVFCPHTTCGLAVTEAEDGLHDDLADVLEHVAPRGRYWAHDDLSRRRSNLVPGDRPNGHSHIRALLATLPELNLPVVDGRPALGPWQRVFLVELDGGRDRRLLVTCWGR